jgi:hypothetical protein
MQYTPMINDMIELILSGNYPLVDVHKRKLETVCDFQI